jgi:RNA polymerase sigma factor (sigma-70 family)
MPGSQVMRTLEVGWEKEGPIMVNHLAMVLLAQQRSEELIAEAERSARARTLRPVEDRLTRREREVADLAARGLTNRQIADLLVISVRTVENQLYRAYAKLGVAGRNQLGAELGRPGA